MKRPGRRPSTVPDWGIPLIDLLRLPDLVGSRMVAGEPGVNRRVRGINVMEVPGQLDWTRPGDLVCTTAYTIRDNPDVQRTIVPALAERGVVALGVKTLYLQRIPHGMIDEANRLGFPLVEFPADISFSDVIRPVMTEILDRQNAFLRQSESTHRELMEVALEQGGLPALFQRLAPVLGNPACLEDVNGRLLATTGQVESLFADLLESPERTADDNPQDRVPSFLRYAERVQVAWRNRPIGRVSVAVRAAGRHLGRLLTWESERPLTRLGYLVLEQSAAIAALLLLQQDAVAQVERRYRNLFLDQLLTGRIESPDAARAHARLLGWDLSAPFMVLLFRLASDQPLENERLLSAGLAWRASDELVAAGERTGDLIFLYRPPQVDATAKNAAARVAQQLLRELQVHAPIAKVRVGISRICHRLADAPRAYQEAQQAAAAGHRQVQGFDDLGALRLLHLVQERGELETFREDTIGPLLTYDQEHGTQLTQTLQAFLAANGNVRQAAEGLFVHYNTVLYRLERIRDVTGLDPQVAEDRLNLHLGLKLLELG